MFFELVALRLEVALHGLQLVSGALQTHYLCLALLWLVNHLTVAGWCIFDFFSVFVAGHQRSVLDFGFGQGLIAVLALDLRVDWPLKRAHEARRSAVFALSRKQFHQLISLSVL